MTNIPRHIKHYVKLAIGRSDPAWPFFSFEKSIRAETWRGHDEIIATAEKGLREKELNESETAYRESDDPLVRQGYELKKKIEREFKDKYREKTGVEKETMKDVRILIHVPNEHVSPAGYSLFMNFAEAFSFLGVPVDILGWEDTIEEKLDHFKPTIFLTSDHRVYLERINWDAVAKYRKDNRLLIGLTAGLEEYGNTPLRDRLAWAKKHGIDFYYTYRDRAYIETRKEYQPFFDAGYEILPLAFGANILSYYPVPNIAKDLNYVFLGSPNTTKAPRYKAYLGNIVKKYSGFIDGPGWSKIKHFSFNRDRDRYIYARAKIGLNIHLPEQIDWANEVNERVYMLAACGVPQITDNAKLLHTLFSPDAFFIATTPAEYQDFFREIINHPELAQARALVAQKETFEKYTTFHRVDAFIRHLKKLRI